MRFLSLFFCLFTINVLFFVSLGPAPVFAAAGRKSGNCSRLIEGIRQRYSGRLNRAVTALEQAVIEKGDIAAAYLHLGLTYEINGDREKAREYYVKALEKRPGYVCARYYLERLDSHRSSTASALVTDAEELGNPDVIVESFSRYRGRKVKLGGRLMCWPCTRGPKPIMLVTTSSTAQVRSDSDMKGVFIVRLSRRLPDDPRVRPDALVEVWGTVEGREYVFHPYLRVESTKRVPVIKPEFIRISSEALMAGPLIVR